MIIKTKAFFRDLTISVPFISGFLLLIGMVSEIAVANRPSSEVIFLHYSVVAGVSITGMWSELYVVPLIAGIFCVFNYIFAWHAFSDRAPVSRILAWVTLVMTIGTWWGIHLLLVFNG